MFEVDVFSTGPIASARREGEYFRNSTTVNIIDNDGKCQAVYSITPGGYTCINVQNCNGLYIL